MSRISWELMLCYTPFTYISVVDWNGITGKKIFASKIYSKKITVVIKGMQFTFQVKTSKWDLKTGLSRIQVSFCGQCFGFVMCASIRFLYPLSTRFWTLTTSPTIKLFLKKCLIQAQEFFFTLFQNLSKLFQINQQICSQTQKSLNISYNWQLFPNIFH